MYLFSNELNFLLYVQLEFHQVKVAEVPDGLLKWGIYVSLLIPFKSRVSVGCSNPPYSAHYHISTATTLIGSSYAYSSSKSRFE